MPAPGRYVIGGLLVKEENIMEMLVKGKITGAKFFKGDVEGTEYDSTTIYMETDLDDGSETAKGRASQAFKWGKSEEFHKIKHLPFPFEAEIVLRQVTNGKNGLKTVVVSVKPVAQVKP